MTHRTLEQGLAAAAQPLPAVDDPAFGAAFDRFADRRVLLLGEASHGTSEFYAARAAITRHLTGLRRALLDLRRGRADDSLRRELAAPRLQRYIGVVYRPHTERWSHYAESSLARQYDAFVWFDTTHAVTPLGSGPGDHRHPDTHPFGE